MNQNQSPTILIILGVTGDLAAKKILPALYNLHSKQELPEHFKIVGFGRKPLTEGFGDYVADTIEHRLGKTSPRNLKSFTKLLQYVQGTFETQTSFDDLAVQLQALEKQWGKKAHYLFYLSVPPDIYEPILNNIHNSALYQRNNGTQTRILVEKPIGKNQVTADSLELILSNGFREEEIYRIDHYLAKEMVQNILTFRFANDMFEKSWNSESIEKIEIRLWEKLGVENRGNFYDGLGALRDVGQNHLLQMISLLTMNRPIDFTAHSLHAKRSEILNKLVPLSVEQIPEATYRAQYSGYLAITGVIPQSHTETYFKIRGFLDNERWRNVPIIIESGKRMHQQKKEVIVTYRHAQPCECPNQNQHHKNKISFALEPFEGINIEFWSKKPGLTLAQEPRTIDFMLRDAANKPQYIEEYEKLLLDSILGDQTLFVSTAEVKAMWRFIDPIIEAWDNNLVPLDEYVPDTDEAAARSLAVDGMI